MKKVPLICKIRSHVYKSPSAMWGRCLLGVRHYNKHCKDCENNVMKIISERLFCDGNTFKKGDKQ